MASLQLSMQGLALPISYSIYPIRMLADLFQFTLTNGHASRFVDKVGYRHLIRELL